VSARKILLAAGLLGVAIPAACHRKPDKSESIVLTSATCPKCSPATEVGALTAKEMDEISGVVASTTRDDVYFVHNDSGDRARFFAIDGHGARLATFAFSKADVVDCEEIARGPCAPNETGPSCLYIGDIGDNSRSRSQTTVYRVKEPDVIADATVPSDPLVFGYPDGPHNAEALLVHPKTGVLTIVTKEARGPSSIFEAPLPFTPGVKVTLKKVGTVQAPVGNPLITAASVHPDATGILLRTYTHAFYAPMRPDQSIADGLQNPLCTLPILHEEQGEAIGWQRDGKGFVTISEGVGAKVNVTRCGGGP
jgi:hypothetical protein